MADLNFRDIYVHNQIWQRGNFFSYETESRPYCGICFIVSGGIKYKTETADISASIGDAVILKKDARYRAIFDAKLTHDILINFYCESLNEVDGFFSAS